MARRKWRLPEEAPELPYDIYEVNDEGYNFEYFCEQIRVMGVCAVDTETNSNLMPDKKKGEKFFDWAQGARAFTATFCASTESVFATYDPRLCLNMLQEIDSLGARKVFQNYKFDAHHLREWADYTPATLNESLDDTMFGFRLKFPRQRAALKTASQRYVRDFDVTYYQRKVTDWLATHQTLKNDTMVFKKKKKGETGDPELIGIKTPLWYEPRIVSFADVPKEIMLPYSTGDAYLTLRSWYGLNEDKAFESQLYKDEVSLAQLLVRVEKAGWHVRKRQMGEYLELARHRYMEARKALSLLHPTLDPHSSLSLIRFFIDELGETIIFYTEHDEPSMNENALIGFNKAPHIRDAVLMCKRWRTTLNQVENIYYFISGDECLHSTFKPEAAKTGRFGSENPPLQNLTSYDEKKEWTWIRKHFAPEDEYVHVFADYSQIEMVIYADYTNDPGLCDAIRDGLDLHTNTASKMFGIPFDRVSKLQRSLGKRMNFTIIFGAGKNKVAFVLKYGDKGEGAVTFEEIELILGRRGNHLDLSKFLLGSYDDGFPVAKQWRYQVRIDVEARRPRPWIRNKFGRVVPIDSGYEYKAPNYLIQGTAADLMKNSMRRAWTMLEEYCEAQALRPWVDIALFSTIHDDLGFKCPRNHVNNVAPIIQRAMCDWPQFRVPIRAEFSLVTPESSWAEKKVFKIEDLEKVA